MSSRISKFYSKKKTSTATVASRRTDTELHPSPDGVGIKENIRIYVLCHTDERFRVASTIYGKYYWAVPILMKYQDVTFENAFWKQLLEIREEWADCAMVGVISFSAHKKINLHTVDSIVRNRCMWETGYYNFGWVTNKLYDYFHPTELNIMKNDICTKLNMKMPTIAYFNYWMCTPTKMLQFIPWVTSKLIPAVLEHPFAMNNSNYWGLMPASALKSLCGVPYYPFVPFVLERLNKAFFTNYDSIVNGPDAPCTTPCPD